MSDKQARIQAADLSTRRAAKLKEIEDQVTRRMTEPWETRLLDLVLYAQMNRNGVRMSDIQREIVAELRRGVPN